MQDEIQRKADEYEKTKSTMNATKQQETETNLNQLMQKYQQAYQDNQQELAKQQQEKMAPIMNKITTAIKNVGKNGGYVYIMDVSAGIPYISDTLSKDVTADVKAEVNKIK
jgi:outer membrane protein